MAISISFFIPGCVFIDGFSLRWGLYLPGLLYALSFLIVQYLRYCEFYIIKCWILKYCLQSKLHVCCEINVSIWFLSQRCPLVWRNWHRKANGGQEYQQFINYCLLGFHNDSSGNAKIVLSMCNFLTIP